MTPFLDQVWAIVAKDVRSELRTKDIFTSLLLFALLVLVVFSFAFEPGTQATRQATPGLLWVAFIFAGVLGLNRAFTIEKDRGSLEGLLLCPVDRTTIYWGKLASSLLLMLAMEVLVFPLFAIFFNLPLWLPALFIIAPLGTIGFVAVGTLFSAIAVHTRAREFMLPLLLFPVLVPVVIAAVESTRTALDSGVLSGSWLPLLLAFDVLFLAVSSLGFEFVLEE